MANRNFSAYLDLLRLSSAIGVVFFHLKLLEIGPESVRRYFPGLGHEFVIIFFVLSGYVIAWSVQRKPENLTVYALNRLARIWSVAIPALLLSALVSWIFKIGTVGDSLIALGVNAIFMGQSWSLAVVPSSNPAYWSLCYEAMYYLLFGSFFYLRGVTRIVVCALAALLAGPKVLLLLPCWLVGVAAFHCTWHPKKSAPWLAVCPLVVLGLLSYLGFGAWISAKIELTQFGWSNHFAKDTVTATLIGIHLYAMRSINLSIPTWLASFAARGAAQTFTLYLIHYPVVLAVREFFDVSNSSTALICTVVAIVASTALVSSQTESRRGAVRQKLASFFVFANQKSP